MWRCTEIAQCITCCRVYNLAEARRLSSPWKGASPAKTRAFSIPSQAHEHLLRPSTHCEKLSEVDILHHARADDLGKRGNVVRLRAGSASKALSVSATIE